MEQAVLVRFALTHGGFGSPWELEVLGGLANDLTEAIEESNLGEFDGTECGEGEYLMYLYGPNADDIFEFIQPLLSRQRWPGAVVAKKRYGPPGADEETVVI